MENITNVSIEEMPKSNFLKPIRMNYTQNGRERFWDFVKVHNSVSTVLFNTSRNVLIFVKQFRPPAMKHTGDNSLQDVDWTKVPTTPGVTLELCAGIVDVNLPLNEIAKKEVLEECGYDVPLENFQRLIQYQGGIGNSGDRITVFYAECKDEMKVSAGGGNIDEGEFIEVVEMGIPAIREYISRAEVASPGGFLYAVTWFLNNKCP